MAAGARLNQKMSAAGQTFFILHIDKDPCQCYHTYDKKSCHSDKDILQRKVGAYAAAQQT